MRRGGVLITPGEAVGTTGGGVEPGGLLPLHLGGQALAGPRRVGLRLEKADVHDGFIGWDRLGDAEPGPPPRVAVALPKLRSQQACVAPVCPAPPAPPAR